MHSLAENYVYVSLLPNPEAHTQIHLGPNRALSHDFLRRPLGCRYERQGQSRDVYW